MTLISEFCASDNEDTNFQGPIATVHTFPFDSPQKWYLFILHLFPKENYKAFNARSTFLAFPHLTLTDFYFLSGRHMGYLF